MVMKARRGFWAGLLAGLVYGSGLWIERAEGAPAFGAQNIHLQPGLNLIGPQLASARGNAVTNIFAFLELPNGTTVYKLVNGSFTTNEFRDGVWQRPGERVEAGDGAFVLNPSDEVMVISHHGEILQGELVNEIPAGLSLQSCMILKDGKVTTDFGLRLSPFDHLYLWEEDGLKVFTYLPGERWTPEEPVLQRGEGCVINAAEVVSWVMNFSLEE